MNERGKAIKELRTSLGKSQEWLAKKLGVGRSTIGMYEAGFREPSFEVYEALADIFNVPLSYFSGAGSDLPAGALPIQKRRIPLIGEIAAGQPILANEEIEEYIMVEDETRCDYALRIKGDSMLPRLQNGDLVFIRIQADVDDGQIAAVLVEDSATLKHVYHTPEGITLVSDNPDYPPIAIKREDCETTRILGLAVKYQRNL